MKPSYDTLAVRLVEILKRFNDGQRLSVKELAEEFNVSERTIQRDLNEKFAFLPFKDRGCFYRLEDYALGKLSFKDIKSFATICGVSELYPELDDGFISDILNDKINQIYLIKAQSHEDISTKKNEFEKLSLACLKNFICEFSYKNKKRLVKPYKMTNIDGVWYLLADEEGRLKTFSFSKIKQFTISEKTFEPSVKMQKLIEEDSTKYFGETKELILEVKNEAKEYFLRKKTFANMQILEYHKEYFLVKASFNFDDEVLAFVRYWIPYIKIVSPKHLQDKLKSALREYLNIL